MEAVKKVLWFIGGIVTFIAAIAITPFIVYLSGIKDSKLIGSLVQYLPLIIAGLISLLAWKKSKLFAVGALTAFLGGLFLLR